MLSNETEELVSLALTTSTVQHFYVPEKTQTQCMSVLYCR